jgi:uncharacterized phage protein (TIGR02218 family)
MALGLALFADVRGVFFGADLFFVGHGLKSIPPLLQADLQASCTTLAFCWTIELGNGKVIRGTDHDLDIVLGDELGSPIDSPANKFAGTYYAIANVTAGNIVSSSDMTVDNLEVVGAFPQAPYTEITDITVDEIEAGLLDMAPVTVLITNWAAPSHGFFIAKTGYLGAITRNSDGKYTTEVRGLSQLLSQNIIRTYSSTCNVVKFGDNRCRFNVAAITIEGTVVTDSPPALYNRRTFLVDLTQASPRPVYRYGGGTITFVSGLNSGFSREVKLDPNANGGVLTVWDDFPENVQPGDAFTLSPGCDRLTTTCFGDYNNLVHWRGYGVFIPGLLALTAGPTTPTGMQ